MDNRIRILKFRTEYRAGKAPRDYVEYTSQDGITGDGHLTHSTSELVHKMIPPEDGDGLKVAAMRALWEQISPAYEAWKKGMEMPEYGTPLGVWPGVSSEQAEALRSVGIKTVEDVAQATEAVLSRPILPQMRELKRQAGLWLEGRGAAELQARLADLEARNAEMLAMLAEQQADKPKRGRPAKQVEQEEEAA